MAAQVKFEFDQSPAESIADSFTSTPGHSYPPLFAPTMNPSEVMTPESFDDDDDMFDRSSMTPGPSSDKKQVKKRKSWGQQLPEPKTNLPPRKRAKTEDEKEQRRVERVLRNRRAAQSSRERKRLEVEGLEAEKSAIERRNRDLEMRLADMEERNLRLEQQLAAFTGGMTAFRQPSIASSTHQEQLRASSPISLSQPLFTSQDHQNVSEQNSTSTPSQLRTVDPSSLSPELRPVDNTNASSTDMTQHPAAMLCDLQCQSAEQRPWMSTNLNSLTTTYMAWTIFLAMTSTATSLAQIFRSLKQGCSLPPTASILSSIIWLATTTSSSTISTSTTFFTTTKTHSQRLKSGLRMKLLRSLLACSPHLARPLMDATLETMRSASEQQLARGQFDGAAVSENRGSKEVPTTELLLTLLWAIKSIDKEHQSRESSISDPAVEIRQAVQELDGMFGRSGISIPHIGRSSSSDSSQKSVAYLRGRLG